MRRFSASTTWLGVILGAVVVLGATACTAGGGTQAMQSGSPDSAISTNAARPAESSGKKASSDGARIPGGSDLEDAAASDSTQQSSVELPDGLPDIGIPFYPYAREIAAVVGADPFFMGEYITNHELTIVNMFFRDALNEGGWEIVDKSVQGSNTVSKVRKPGYFLVIVVGPNRTVDTDTSIHYTLRAQ